MARWTGVFPRIYPQIFCTLKMNNITSLSCAILELLVIISKLHKKFKK